MLVKRVALLLAAALGLLGVVACLAAVYPVWSVWSRLDRVNDRAFTLLDNGLASAQDRIRGVQTRIRDSKITTDQIGRGLRTWTTEKADQWPAARTDIERRAEDLTRSLQTADLWLEAATETIRGVRQVLELGNLAGGRVDPAALEDVLDRLASLRDTVRQAEQTVDRVREIAGGKDAETSEESRRSRVTSLVARTVLTIGEIDTRLEEPIDRLAQAQADARELKERINRYIALAAAGCYLLLAWIAAGQAALCVGGWRAFRRSGVSANRGRLTKNES